MLETRKYIDDGGLMSNGPIVPGTFDGFASLDLKMV